MAKVTTVGDRVKLKKDNLLGVVQFIGSIQGKKGTFYGVVLDDAKGKNNGSVAKVAYFKCAKNKGLFVKKDAIAKTNSKKNDAPRITVGDKVKCKKQKCSGTVRFVGTPYSVKSEGVFYGVELEKAKGKNNGTVKGRWYFACKDKYGCFVQASGIDMGAAAAVSKDKKKTSKPKKKEAAEDEKKEDVEYKVGDRVMIKPNKKGQIKWIGEAKEFGEGKYYGIRLTEDRGDCDGEFKEVRFFQCPEGFGVYVQLRFITQMLDDTDFDFMKEEEKYEEEARLKAEEYKKEADKLKRLREMFNEVDTDNNQTIDRGEFSKLAKNVFECTSTEANALFKEIDVNDSGSISFAEFDAWVDKVGGVDKLDEMAADKEEEAPAEEPKEEAAEAVEEPAAEEPAAEEAAVEEPAAEEAAAEEPAAEEEPVAEEPAAEEPAEEPEAEEAAVEAPAAEEAAVDEPAEEDAAAEEPAEDAEEAKKDEACDDAEDKPAEDAAEEDADKAVVEDAEDKPATEDTDAAAAGDD